MTKIHAIKLVRSQTGFTLEAAKGLVEGVEQELARSWPGEERSSPPSAPAEPVETLRDRFAATALAGLLANPGLIGGTFSQAAEVAFLHADAMLSAREVKL